MPPSRQKGINGRPWTVAAALRLHVTLWNLPEPHFPVHDFSSQIGESCFLLLTTTVVNNRVTAEKHYDNHYCCNHLITSVTFHIGAITGPEQEV